MRTLFFLASLMLLFFIYGCTPCPVAQDDDPDNPLQGTLVGTETNGDGTGDFTDADGTEDGFQP